MHTLDEKRWTELLERQRTLEESAYAEGARAFKIRLIEAEQKGRATMVGGAKRLLQEGIAGMEESIREMCEMKTGRGAGKRHTAAKWCALVGYDVAAYMTLKVVLDNIARPNNPLRVVAMNVVNLITDELKYRRFQEQAPGLFEYKFKNFHTSSYTHMARSLNASMNIADIDTSDLEMSPSQKMRVGVKLIDILMDCTGLVELDHRSLVASRGRIKTEVYLKTTQDTEDWLTQRNEAMALLQPVVMPMVVPPLKWGPGIHGGYRFALRRKTEFVRKVSKEQQQRIREAAIPMVYETINTLQNTAWKINLDVLEVVRQIMEQGGGTAGLPQVDKLKLPAKPQDIDTNPAARKRWRKQAAMVKEADHARRQKALAVQKVLSAVKTIEGEAAIYFPYSLDFRGRVYPIAAYLTPQGDDLSRGLLKFADGKPMDQAAARWLAIHGANCLGDTPEGEKVSKLTLDERWDWIIRHTVQLVQVGQRPLEDLWWTAADKPLQFLAFCQEWSRLLEANDRGEEYVCSLPVSMDGSCNGLQHFSALLLDEVGGAAVNVVPQDRPQDIYSKISDKVLDKLVDRACDPIAALWLGLHRKTGIVDRKLAKRPTMTFGYGSKRFGFKAQIHEYLSQHEDWKSIRAHFTLQVEGEDKGHISAACTLMSELVWEALNEVVVAAFDGMAWMQRATRGITRKQNKAVEWTVPLTGFPVRQEYYHLTRKRVTTMLAGSLVGPSVYEPTKNVNPVKQSNAIAPNFVHSLDAAALMLTVSMSSAEGVEQFAMIHDSYGTVPADCEVLARCCRQAFARLYLETDVVQVLFEELKAQWDQPDSCPLPPKKGSLDVSQVLASVYFFA